MDNPCTRIFWQAPLRVLPSGAQSGVMHRTPSDAVVMVWVRLMRAQRATLSAMEDAAKQAGLPPLLWYDALLELDRAGAAGRRPAALERAMLMAQYGVSRLADRLEAEGLIERRPCAEDGRGQILVITPAGRALRRRIWPVYADAIARVVGDRITEEEAAALIPLLEKLGPPAAP